MTQHCTELAVTGNGFAAVDSGWAKQEAGRERKEDARERKGNKFWVRLRGEVRMTAVAAVALGCRRRQSEEKRDEEEEERLGGRRAGESMGGSVWFSVYRVGF